MLRHAVSRLDRTSPNSWERFDCQSLLGRSLAGQAKYAEAEPLIVGGYQGMSQRKSTPQAANSLATPDEAGQAIVSLYQAWGKPDKAAEWTSKLRAAN
jgi:hypothetical protein